MTPTGSAELYDPLFHTPQENVYEIYSILRQDHPVYYSTRRAVWCITRYTDVQAAGRDWKTFGTAPGVDIDAPNYMGPGNFIDTNPPRHDVLRNVVRPFFTPKAIAALEDVVARRVDTIIRNLKERERADLAHDFAWQLPIWVISRLLGVPEEDDENIQRTLLEIFHREPGQVSVPAAAQTAMATLHDYVHELAEHKRKDPDEKILSRIVAGEAADAPSPEETIGMATGLYIAGSETTFALLGNSLNLLADYPETLEVLRRDPRRETIDAFIEEALRFESPVQYLARTARAPSTLHGQDIAEGERLVLIWGAANRDRERWPDGDRFDIYRPQKRHVAFGEGIHFCLGAPLARLEARLALPAFIRAFPKYEIINKQRLPNHLVRGWEHLEAVLSD